MPASLNIPSRRDGDHRPALQRRLLNDFKSAPSRRAEVSRLGRGSLLVFEYRR